MAERTNTSMNQLAERMIERELEVLSLGLETDLAQTVELLRSYRSQRRRESWSAFAEAEDREEPIKARRVDVDRDPFGIGRAFAEAGG